MKPLIWMEIVSQFQFSSSTKEKRWKIFIWVKIYLTAEKIAFMFFIAFQIFFFLNYLQTHQQQQLSTHRQEPAYQFRDMPNCR